MRSTRIDLRIRRFCRFTLSHPGSWLFTGNVFSKCSAKLVKRRSRGRNHEPRTGRRAALESPAGASRCISPSVTDDSRTPFPSFGATQYQPVKIARGKNGHRLLGGLQMVLLAAPSRAPAPPRRPKVGRGQDQEQACRIESHQTRWAVSWPPPSRSLATMRLFATTMGSLHA